MEISLRPHHVGISVADMDASIQWYSEALGMRLRWLRDFPEIHAKIAFLEREGFQVELFEHHQSIPQPLERRMPLSDIQTQGAKHICFETNDIEALFAHLRSLNADIVFGPVESPPKDALFGFIRDPSGTLIEILQLYPTE